MCRQAKDRYILIGDLHYAQSLALRIAELSGRYESWESEKRLYTKMDMIFDRWLSFDKPAAWEEVKKARARREEEEQNDVNVAELSADNMGKLMELMRKAAVAEGNDRR